MIFEIFHLFFLNLLKNYQLHLGGKEKRYLMKPNF